MNALERAQELIKAANEAEYIDGYIASIGEAHALAAIAQATALERMAAAMEQTAKCQERILALEETYHERMILRERLTQKVQEAEQTQSIFTEIINTILSSELAKK